MSDLTQFLVLSFVVFRLTRFLMHDTLIERQRMWLLIRIAGRKPKVRADGSRYQAAWRAKLMELASCPWCVSLHVAWITVLVADQWASIPLPWMYWVAIGGASLVIWDRVDGA